MLERVSIKNKDVVDNVSTDTESLWQLEHNVS